MASFASRIKELRQEHKLTQEELARQLGTTKSAISMYERGDRKPNFEITDAMTEFFDVSTAYLSGASDKRGRYPAHDDGIRLSAYEIRLIEAYRNASTDTQKAVRAVHDV